MSSLTTTNRAVPYPAEGDVPDVAADLHTLATYIDGNNAKATSGTSLPATGMTLGDEFLLTTTGIWYKYSGSAWRAMQIAGAWTPLTLAGGVTTFAPGCNARLVGDAVEVQGVLKNSTGAVITSGTQIATMPSAAYGPPTLQPIFFISAISAVQISGTAVIWVDGNSWQPAAVFEMTPVRYYVTD